MSTLRDLYHRAATLLAAMSDADKAKYVECVKALRAALDAAERDLYQR